MTFSFRTHSFSFIITEFTDGCNTFFSVFFDIVINFTNEPKTALQFTESCRQKTVSLPFGRFDSGFHPFSSRLSAKVFVQKAVFAPQSV